MYETLLEKKRNIYILEYRGEADPFSIHAVVTLSRVSLPYLVALFVCLLAGSGRVGCVSVKPSRVLACQLKSVMWPRRLYYLTRRRIVLPLNWMSSCWNHRNLSDWPTFISDNTKKVFLSFYLNRFFILFIQLEILSFLCLCVCQSKRTNLVSPSQTENMNKFHSETNCGLLNT